MNVLEKDKQFVWHPFTQIKTASPPITIVRGEGALLFDQEGKAYIDGISSWWVNLHGHSHPYIAEKISEQASILEQVIFAGFTHAKAVELAERLIRILPSNQSKIFFSDNGSTAVEVAIKMAVQYWHNREKKKTRILALTNSYHGDTFGAMSAAPDSDFTKPFRPMLFDVSQIPIPVAGEEAKSMEELQKQLVNDDIAAFIFEPLVQGVGGMIMYEPAPLDELIRLCQSHGVFTIADEVMTGFGRTGKLFSSDYLEEEPDMICLSKGITGGVLPLGATSCKKEIFEAFLSEEKHKMFFHGHSFTANSISCTAALASLDLLLDPSCQENISRIEKRHEEFCRTLSLHENVSNCRVRGTIFAADVDRENTTYFHPSRDSLYTYFIENGVLLRPLGNVIYILPPFCITDEQLGKIYQVIIDALDTLK